MGLAVALVAAAAVLLSLGSELTFFQDSWDFLINRREPSADAFLLPHNEHIVVFPTAISQLLLQTFGMTSATPELVALIAFLLVTAILVFVYVRRRTGPWPALMAAVVLLFLGPAWQDLLWPFQIGLVGSVLFGVAMLLALERDDDRGDALGCGFLALSLGFSSLGLPFAIGAAVDVIQRRGRRGLRRAYVAALPLLIYAVWYLGWGHEAASHLTFHNVLVSPRFVWESLVASVDSLLALSTIAGEAVGRSKWGIPFLLAALALTAHRYRHRPGLPSGLWPVLTAASAFWFLAAFNQVPGREPYSSRYLYPGCVFVILIGANLLNGVRLSRPALLAGGAVTAIVVGFNLTPLHEGRDFLRGQSELTRADLAAVEISRRTIDPSFSLVPEVAGTSYLVNVRADEYLTAVRDYGSPAYTPAELAAAPPAARSQADVVLANALPVTAEASRGRELGPPARCRQTRAAAPPLPLRSGLIAIALPAGRSGTIRLRRFAAGYPLQMKIAAGTTTLLRIPSDGAARPWRLRIDAAQGATVCARPPR